MTTKKMENVIKRLVAFDLDSTLMNTPSPEEGIPMWEKATGEKYPHKESDWWYNPESLDLEIFDIQPFPAVMNQFKQEKATPNTLVFILTSRPEKLRSEVQVIMDKHGIDVELEMFSNDNRTKGDKIIELLDWYPDLEEINVYDDRQKEIDRYLAVKDKIPEYITFNIYVADEGKLALYNPEKGITGVINEEIQNFFNSIYKK